jgi:tRNA (cytidine/uridine-2'-O-)-methyltransferase
MKVILFQPQIPQNTGNIARTCAVTGCDLLLVRPLGFSTASRHLKRAGLDYWSDICVEQIDDLLSYLDRSTCPFFFFSSKASALYTEADYTPDAQLIFGSETSGLDDVFWQRWPNRFYRIPMRREARCLNLSCTVAITVYEALRQQKFHYFERRDHLLNRSDNMTVNKNDVVKGR